MVRNGEPVDLGALNIDVAHAGDCTMILLSIQIPNASGPSVSWTNQEK